MYILTHPDRDYHTAYYVSRNTDQFQLTLQD